MTTRKNTEGLADAEVRDLLAPGQVGDDTVLRIVAALREAGARVDVEDAGGEGADRALVVAVVDGRRVRLTAEPW